MNRLYKRALKESSWSLYNKLREGDAQPAQAQQDPNVQAADPNATAQTQDATAQQAAPAQDTTQQAAPAADPNAQAQQAAPAQDPSAQQQASAQNAAPQQPQQAQSDPNMVPGGQGVNTQAQAQQINTQPAQVAPQSQIAAAQAQPAQPQQQGTPAPTQESMKATSWADFYKMNESIAMPGGCLDVKPTEYEKELDKHNKARKNTKVCGEVGDKDAGEIGAHGYDEEKGTPTATLSDILKPRKSSKLILTGEK